MQKKLLPLIHTDETLILAVYGFLQATPFFTNSIADKFLKLKVVKNLSLQTNDFGIWFFIENAFIRVDSVFIRG